MGVETSKVRGLDLDSFSGRYGIEKVPLPIDCQTPTILVFNDGEAVWQRTKCLALNTVAGPRGVSMVSMAPLTQKT